MFETCGIAHLDLNLLLDVKTDDDYKEWRTIMLSELETFVAETKRFATRPSCQLLRYAHHQIPSASDFFQEWWTEVTHGAKNGGSFSEMMGPRIC